MKTKNKQKKLIITQTISFLLSNIKHKTKMRNKKDTNKQKKNKRKTKKQY